MDEPTQKALGLQKTARTTAKRKVTIAASKVRAACDYEMDGVSRKVETLDDDFCCFLVACQEFSDFCKVYKITEEHQKVAAESPKVYFAGVETDYKDAMKRYKEYIATLGPPQSSASPAPSSAFPESPTGSGASSPRITSSDVSKLMFKKRDLPTFSGSRAEWPEFRTIWEKTVVPCFGEQKLALASELKRSVKGEALLEVAHIAITSDSCYDDMWNALKAHFDNVTLSVWSALEQLRKLKRGRDDDHSYSLKLVRQIVAVHAQITSVGQIDQVDAIEVAKLQDLLPSHTRELWAEKYATLESSAQFHPFDDFVSFLKTRIPTFKVMSDLKQAVALKSSPSPVGSKPPQKWTSRTHAATSVPAANQCALHPGGSHSFESCESFLRLSTHDRAALCTQHERCKRCLGNRHPGSPCETFTRCSKCGKSSHCDLLCFGDSNSRPSDSERYDARNSSVRKPYGNCNRTQSSVKPKAVPSRSANISSNPANEPPPPMDQGPINASEPVVEGGAVHHGTAGACSTTVTRTYALRKHAYGLYAIYASFIDALWKTIIFCDNGSDLSLITEAAAKRVGARMLERGFLDSTTIHGTQSQPTTLYEIMISTELGRQVPIVCYSVPDLVGTPQQLDERILTQVFPSFSPKQLQRPSGTIEILLGADYFGLHPKFEVVSDGYDLSVMKGELGVCVQGSHPGLSDTVLHSPYTGSHVAFRSNYARTDIPHHIGLLSAPHGLTVNADPVDLMYLAEPEPSGADTYAALPDLVFDQDEDYIPLSSTFKVHARMREETVDVDRFILGEQLGTEIVPHCGACKCGKCPLPGHTYSFQEEQELQLIQSKLRYDAPHKRWVAGYPWLVEPSTLSDNYPAVYSTLCRTERTLDRDSDWKSTYQKQIDDHESRGVARKLSPEEISSWDGPYYYISHMALEQPKSETTPVRLVFNSSQKYKGVSLNSCLAKGPDCFNNSLLGMLLRFREYPTVLIGDIKKMYNTVHLELLEQHMHRFLWRECEDRKPDVWVITRVNLGDRPSGTIAITAKDNTARMFAHVCPEAASILIYCTYTDDVITSTLGGFSHAQYLAVKSNEILAEGGFVVKGWTFGGPEVPEASMRILPQQVLGVFYSAPLDCIYFPAKLNFSEKRRGVPLGPNLTAEEVPDGIPLHLTRRIVLQQVMSIYDPLGLLSPFLLQAKLLLRHTWEAKLEWDEKLPPQMYVPWVKFFNQLFDAERIEFPRCVMPPTAVGDPVLVLMSDGSEVSYGCTAYVRWELEDGSYSCQLLLAKSRIAPMNRINIPQMELNGAVVSKRLRQTILKESRYKFSKIHQLVDSETVLCQLHKLSTRFKVFEGVRIGEIQAATEGDMSSWGWIPGRQNVADLTTRPQEPSALGPASTWMRGPAFLYRPEDEWPVKRNPHVNDTEALPGEKSSISSVMSAFAVQNGAPKTGKKLNVLDFDLFLQSYERCDPLAASVGGFARVLSALKARSFSGGRTLVVTPELRQAALVLHLRAAQRSAWTSSHPVQTQFKVVFPVLKGDLWVVGTRLSSNPLTPDNKPQVLLPPHHPLTYKLMVEAHNSRHAGREATLSTFRARYYTSHASRLAQAVCSKCILCKRLRVQRLTQMMGQMPPERLMPSPPFDSLVLDLFGPYMVRGEVQKRTTSKVWGVIFVDLASRAVHIEITSGYDTKSFLLALRRFSAIRGWPSTIFSDPGSQLVGASEEIQNAWSSMDRDALLLACSQSGTRWIFGPADSPWYQGAAESLIKSAKTSLSASIGSSRLSMSELLTVFTEVANLLNERPIGFRPYPDDEVSILTPNILLLGRSTRVNPGGYESSSSVFNRVTMVQDCVTNFWKHWTSLYAPTLVQQSKWMHESRSLQVGDLVLVADTNVMRGEYRVARVHAVHPSADGIIRRVSVVYKIYKAMTPELYLQGGRDVVVERSVQKLSLLLPYSEQ